MTIDWKDATKELPKDGEYVAAMRYHWKHCWPLSAEITFGEVESYINGNGIRVARVNTNDFTGSGSSSEDFPFGDYPDSDTIRAWAYAKDFKRPDFMVHDTHWGDEK